MMLKVVNFCWKNPSRTCGRNPEQYPWISAVNFHFVCTGFDHGSGWFQYSDYPTRVPWWNCRFTNPHQKISIKYNGTWFGGKNNVTFSMSKVLIAFKEGDSQINRKVKRHDTLGLSYKISKSWITLLRKWFTNNQEGEKTWYHWPGLIISYQGALC